MNGTAVMCQHVSALHDKHNGIHIYISVVCEIEETYTSDNKNRKGPESFKIIIHIVWDKVNIINFMWKTCVNLNSL